MTVRHALVPAMLLLAACSSGKPQNGTPAPVISSFTADSPTVTPGQTTTLRWSVAYATSISIDTVSAPSRARPWR